MDIPKEKYVFIKSPKRNKILEECKNPLNFTSLKKATNLSSPALEHHLKILEKYDLIQRKILEEKGKKKRGNEVLIKTNIEKLKQIEKTYPKLNKEKLKSLLILLELIGCRQNGASWEEIEDLIPNEYRKKFGSDLYSWAKGEEGFVSKKIFLSKKGKIFLNEMKEKNKNFRKDLKILPKFLKDFSVKGSFKNKQINKTIKGLSEKEAKIKAGWNLGLGGSQLQKEFIESKDIKVEEIKNSKQLTKK